ncbi:putative oxidoreductase [Mycena sp. CBHHK59/15]|nr:putative oxidoreductase [Mycena sp. CBHHK59/15]
MTDNPDTILVLGAGELGLSMLRSLAKHPPPNSVVKVLLRPSNKPSHRELLSELQSLHIDPVYGDTSNDSIDALSELFRGYTTIVICVGFAAGSGTQLKLARAVLAAGVTRCIPWQFGVDYDIIGRGSPQNLFDEQLDVRDLLRSQTSTMWKIVSTGMFTSFLFEPSFGVVDIPSGICRALGSWESEVSLTTPQDIGRLTAQIITETWEGSGIVYTAGDTVSYKTVAEAVEKLLGRKMDRQLWTVDDLVQKLKEDPADNMKKYRAVFAMGRGVAWPIEGTYNYQKNIAVESMGDWLKGNITGR